MKNICFSGLFLVFLLNGCTTETTYSSHMFGNNQETITTGKKNKLESSNGASLLDNGSSSNKK